MGYVVYTGNDCHDCDVVVKAMKKHKIKFREVQVDRDGIEPPIDVFIRPALFEEDQLLAYGRDILPHFGIAADVPVPLGIMLKRMWVMMTGKM